MTARNFLRAQDNYLGDALLYDRSAPLNYDQSTQARSNLLYTTDDVTFDILKGRAAPGFNGDDATILNPILGSKRAIRIRPDEGIGSLNLKTTVSALLPNTKIVMAGGEQAVQWVRDLTHTGSTLVCGNPTGAGAGSLALEDIFFVHPERFNFYSDHNEGDSLTNRLTAGQSHLEVHGAQRGYARVGGWGCQFGASIFGGSAFEIEPFFYGGIWDPDHVGAQEGIAQVRFTYSATHGYGTTHKVKGGNLYGGNVPKDNARRSVTVETMTVQAHRRIGPLYGVLIESAEDLVIENNFSGGFAFANVAILPVAGSKIINPWIRNCYIDESNEWLIYGVGVTNELTPASLTIDNCHLNGQTITKGGIGMFANGSVYAVRRLRIRGVYATAILGPGMVLRGVDGGQIRECRFSGYNMVREPGIGCAGMFIAQLTRNLSTRDVIFGGGINEDMETDNMDPEENPMAVFGLSPNGTKHGYSDEVGATGPNTYADVRALNFGISGGQLATGTNDTGT